MTEPASFIHLFFVGVLALFPVVNPVGTAFVVLPYLERLDDADKKRATRKIALYAFCVCTVGLLAGQWILKLFGLSIPVVQLAGGILICKMGWELLAAKADSATTSEAAAPAHGDIDDKLFYPLTFPVTTGAGTLSVLFTLSAHGADADIRKTLLNTSATLLAVVVMCGLVYAFYLNAPLIERHLGAQGERILNRLMAFFIFCVGLQIAVAGAKALF